jgi:hypothetical protein
MSPYDRRSFFERHALIIAAVVGAVGVIAGALIEARSQTIQVYLGTDGTATLVSVNNTNSTPGANTKVARQPTYTPLPTYTPYPEQPTHTPYPEQPTPNPAIVPRAPDIYTATARVDEQDPPPGSIVPQGATYERAGIAIYNLNELSASDVEICVGALVIENNKGIEYVLRYKLDVLHLSDDTGRNYARRDTNDRASDQTSIPSGQKETINMGGFSDRLCFAGTVPAEAKYVILTVDEMAGLENLNWRVDLE